jgi:hypothetical protein
LNPGKFYIEVIIIITLAVQSRVRKNPEDAGAAVTYIFRFQPDKILELWDNGQPSPRRQLMKMACSGLACILTGYFFCIGVSTSIELINKLCQ